MNTKTKNSVTETNHDNRFENVDHKCLIHGRKKIKCEHLGCKVAAKYPHYYPGWKTFFKERGTTRFHLQRRDLSKYTGQQLKNIPDEAKKQISWITPMPAGDGNTPNLNTGWVIEAVGAWPDRSIFNFDEVKFINVEYQTLRGKNDAEVKSIIATQDVNKLNFHLKLIESVTDVKEVAIYVGREVKHD